MLVGNIGSTELVQITYKNIYQRFLSEWFEVINTWAQGSGKALPCLSPSLHVVR